MDSELFKDMYFLPDPKIGTDDHYIFFEKIYGTKTSEQHARNVGVVIQCNEYDKWCLLFSKRKLSVIQRKKIEELIVDISYSCGATTDDLVLPETWACVAIRTHDCGDPILFCIQR